MDTIRLRIHVIEQSDFFNAQKESGAETLKVSKTVSPSSTGFRLKLTSHGGESIKEFSAEVKKRFEAVMNVSSSLSGLYDDFFYYLNPDDTVRGLLQKDDLCYLVVKDIKQNGTGHFVVKRGQESGANPPAKRPAVESSAPQGSETASGGANPVVKPLSITGDTATGKTTNAPETAATGPSPTPANAPAKTAKPRGRPRKKFLEIATAPPPANSAQPVEDLTTPQVINETQEIHQAPPPPSPPPIANIRASRTKGSGNATAQSAVGSRGVKRAGASVAKAKPAAIELTANDTRAANSIISASQSDRPQAPTPGQNFTGIDQSSKETSSQRGATLNGSSLSSASPNTLPFGEAAEPNDSLLPSMVSQTLTSFPVSPSQQLFGEDRALTDRAVSEDRDEMSPTARISAQKDEESSAFNLLNRQSSRKLHPEDFGAGSSPSRSAVYMPSPVKPINERSPNPDQTDLSLGLSAKQNESLIVSEQEESNSQEALDAEKDSTGSESGGDDESEDEEEEVRRKQRLQRAKAVSATRKDSVLRTSVAKPPPVRASRQSTQKESRTTTGRTKSDLHKQEVNQPTSAKNGSDTTTPKKAGTKAAGSVPGLGGFAALSKVRPTVHDSVARPKRYEILEDTQSSDEETDSDSDDDGKNDSSDSEEDEAEETQTPRRKRGGALNSLRKL